MALRALAQGLCARQSSWLRVAPSAASGARGFASDEQVDLAVIGGGPGGYVAAIKAAQLGLKVTCIEGRGKLGGTCLNVGCIPSKALLHSTHLYEEIKHALNHGIAVEGAKIDLGKMMAQKDKAVAGLTQGVEMLLKKNKIKYVKGWGKFKSDTEVEVDLLDGGTAAISAKNYLIATGSEVTSLPNVPIDEDRLVSSTGALSLKEIPKKMFVIGGGYIGLEMGSVWSRMGAEVTVIEFLDDVVTTMDADIRKAFKRTLQKQGLKMKLGTKVNKAENTGSGVKLWVEPAKGGKEEVLEADVVLVAAGRKAFFGKGLNLDAAGVQLDRGKVITDKDFRTTAKSGSVYAIGDCIAGPMLAHKAEDDGIACVEKIAGKGGHVNYDTVPLIIYTWPEVASVGKTEDECKKLGLNYKVGKFPFIANSRAKTVDDADGLVKFVADAETDKILGAHIMGPNAGELIPECVLAMEYGASTEDIARTCHGHPTMSEAIREAAIATAFGKAIHA